MIHTPGNFATAPKAARLDAVRSPAEVSWENEGGRLRAGATAPREAAVASSTLGDAERLTTQVRLMAGTLADDFAYGRVGTLHNTYEHRARVLRQLRAKLDRMRAGQPDLAAQEQ